MKFSGKKVLITGAASGIGLAQTKVFLAEGAEVVAVDLQEFTDESIINSKNLSVKILDVSDAQSVEKLADEVGSIDVLLNTAGVLDAYKTLEETDFAEWQRILSTNLNSMYLMISAFLPKMKAQKSGVIINMASVAGLCSKILLITFPSIKFNVLIGSISFQAALWVPLPPAFSESVL